jgi:hypothetical protein
VESAIRPVLVSRDLEFQAKDMGLVEVAPMKRKLRKGKVLEFLPRPDRKPSPEAIARVRMPLCDWYDMLIKADVTGAIPPAVLDSMELLIDMSRASKSPGPPITQPEAVERAKELYQMVMARRGPEVVG